MKKLKQKTNHKTENSKPNTKMPLAESIQKTKKKIKWTKMMDDDIVRYAQKFMEKEQIKRKKELIKLASGLYQILWRRKLLDKLVFEEKQEDWNSKNDEKLVQHAQRTMEKKGIKGKTELYRAYAGLYMNLKRRGLLDRVGFEEKRRDWKSMSDDELVRHAQDFMENKGITERKKLSDTDSGLYNVLRKRKLLDRIDFDNKQRDWKSMSDDELVRHARVFLIKRNIRTKSGLQKADAGLHYVLRKRKILDKIAFDETQRCWRPMSDDGLIRYVQVLLKREGITTRSELQKSDPGLYFVLNKRKVLDRIGFNEKRRCWNSMSDDKLLDHAEKLIKDKKIVASKELENLDSGLYQALLKRKLVVYLGFQDKRGDVRNWALITNDELLEYAQKKMRNEGITSKRSLNKKDRGLYNVLRRRRDLQGRRLSDKLRFEQKCRNWKSMTDDEVVEYAQEFMQKERITGRAELEGADSGLYGILRKRKLMDKVGFENKLRDWGVMSDDELVGYAQEFVKKKGITGRWELGELDRGLYGTLGRRKLLDQVFAPIEQSKQKQAAQYLLNGFLAEFSAGPAPDCSNQI